MHAGRLTRIGVRGCGFAGCAGGATPDPCGRHRGDLLRDRRHAAKHGTVWVFAAIRALRAQPNTTLRWVVRLVAHSLARSPERLSQLVDVGTLWHILPPLFKYDYTLAEGGVQASTETNRQEVRACPKRAARMSLH